MNKIFLIIAFGTVFCSSVTAMEKAPASKPEDLRGECLALLQGPCQYSAPDLSQKPTPEPSLQMAQRVSTIVSNAIGQVFWVATLDASEARKAWRAFTIEALALSTYVRIVGAANDPIVGLTPARVELVKELLQRSEHFIGDYCKKRSQLEEHSDADLCVPFHGLTSAVAETLGAPDPKQKANLEALSASLVNWSASNLLTPEVITKIILAIKFPQEGAQPQASLNSARILKAYPEQCLALGKSVMQAIKHVSSHSLTSGRNAVVNVATAFVSDAEVGAKILAAVEDVLVDENSIAVPIAEKLVKAMSEGGQLQTTPEESQALKAAFQQVLDTKLPALITELMRDEKAGAFKKFVAGLAESPVLKTVEMLKPLIMDLVWNEKARGAQHLLFFYLPPLLQKRLPIQNSERHLHEQFAHIAREFGEVSRDIAARYLWLEEEKENQLRDIFMDTARATTEQLAYLLLTKGGEPTLNHNAIRSARMLTMLHMFLEDYRNNSFRTKIDEADLNKPLVDLVFEILALKFPHDKSLHTRFEALARQGSDALFNTILDARTITNLVIRFDFPNPGLNQAQAAPPVSGERPDAWVHKPFGKAVVRTLRSFLSLSGELSVIDASFVGIANKYHEHIGQRILEGDSMDHVKAIRALLFKQRAPYTGEARAFVERIEDEGQLKAELQKWISEKLMPFIKAQVAVSAPWGTQWLVKAKLDSLIPPLAAKVQEIIWSPNQRALKILLYHYLLPVWREEIIAAVKLSK